MKRKKSGKVKKHRRVAARSSGMTDVMSWTKRLLPFSRGGCEHAKKMGSKRTEAQT